MKLNLCAFDIFFLKVIADILKKLFCLSAKSCCILFFRRFPTELKFKQLVKGIHLTICFGYNMEQYFPIISEDVSDRLADFTRYASTF